MKLSCPAEGPLGRSHMIVGVLAGVRAPTRDLQTAPNCAACQDSVDLRLDQSLEVCHRCDPFNEVFGAAELGDGVLVGWFRLGSLRALVRHASFSGRRCLCARFILRVWGAGPVALARACCALWS